MPRDRQRMQAGERLSQTDKRSIYLATPNGVHPSTLQCLENQNMTLGGVVNHLRKMNRYALAFGALPERRIGAETGLAAIVRVDFGISQNIALCGHALHD